MTTVAGSVSVNAESATHTGTGLAYERFLAKVDEQLAFWASRGLDVSVADKARLYGIWAAEITGDTAPLADAIDAGGGGGGGTVSTDATLSGDGSGGSPLGVNTSTIASKTYVDAADAGKVPTSRTITTSTGLTGGGDLSANRTLAVDTTTIATTAYADAAAAAVVAFTVEAAQDAVGALIVDSSTIDATYDDAGNAETIDVKDASITSAKLDATALAQMHAIANGLFL